MDRVEVHIQGDLEAMTPEVKDALAKMIKLAVKGLEEGTLPILKGEERYE
jgi:hypothetical protein